MARIRSVHPGQWTDDQFVTSSPLARLLSIGVRNHADDHGVFAWNPIKLKMLILPADPVDRTSFDALLQELVDTNQLKRFDVDGRSYGAIRSFMKFQKPKKPMYYCPLPSELVTYVKGTDTEPVSSHMEKPVPHQYGKTSSVVEERREEKKEKYIVGRKPPDRGRPINGYDDIAQDILVHLNEHSGHAYRPVKANISFITARLKEGATPAECKTVIEAKCHEWKNDPKMKKFLRPETLFGATHFAQYQGARETPDSPLPDGVKLVN